MITYPDPKRISFRELVPDITDTNYVTHGLFFHPAKFIPQVVRFCIRHYVPKGGRVFDPFAGSGTTGLEAVIAGADAYLADINPPENGWIFVHICRQSANGTHHHRNLESDL
jgi:DNA modification methylase